MPEWAITLLAGIAGGGVGASAMSAVFYRALKDRLIGDLREVFARRSELNNWGTRVNALETVAIQARDQADTNQDSIIRLQAAETHRWEPMGRALDRIGDRLDAHGAQIQETATILSEMRKWLDRNNQRGGG